MRLTPSNMPTEALRAIACRTPAARKSPAVWPTAETTGDVTAYCLTALLLSNGLGLAKVLSKVESEEVQLRRVAIATAHAAEDRQHQRQPSGLLDLPRLQLKGRES